MGPAAMPSVQATGVLLQQKATVQQLEGLKALLADNIQRTFSTFA